MNEQEIADKLMKAKRIVDDADFPEHMQPKALELVWSLLNGTTKTPASPHADEALEQSPNAEPTTRDLARKLGVDVEALEDVFEPQADGSLRVIVDHRKLPADIKSATRDIALLVCVGRQLRVEAETQAGVIRVVCDEYGKLSGGNFAHYMKDSTELWRISGGGAKGKPSTYKLRRAAWARAGELVRQFTT